MTEPARVLVVDDDELVRRAVCRLLVSEGYEVAALSSALELLEDDRASTAACLVLDLRMPGPSGLEAFEELRSRGVDTPAVFLTGHGTVRDGVVAMKAGAVEFLEKPFDDDELLEAVREAVARSRSDRLENEARAEIEARAATLSPREREVMVLVVQGLLNKQIAGRLGIVERTVKVHRSRVMEKMEAGSLAELVRLAALLGLP